MSNGFGFSFPNNDPNDRDKGNGENNDGTGKGGENPFAAFGFGAQPGQGGNLGDILNQFGQMLSGMGTSSNERSGGDAVNFELALRMARQRIGSSPAVSSADTTAVTESLRLADLWIDNATTLPASSAQPAAWNAEDWLSNTMPMWKRMVNPVAENMNRAQMESMPEQAREMMGPMAGMMNSMNAMNFGMKLGHALGDLAQQALTGTDFGLPVAPRNIAAILPKNVSAISDDLGVPGQEVLVYIAAREAARQRLFTHVPWLVERLVSSVEEYAAGLVIDTSHIEEIARNLDLESGDPQQLQEKLGELQGMDLTPRVSSRNELATSRLETLLALVEGWIDVVVTEALADRIPSTPQLAEAWARRRATGGSAEQAFANIVGIELSAPKVREAAELWRRANTAVGMERRDKVWDHPDFLPTAEHIDNPAAFIDTLLDDAPDTDFDAEVAKLEEELRNQGDNRDDD
ncbi:zinc-dependent metalloprotease [Corynebacterium sanguinis]|uniref:zinc-dependent metalloprotease n=1 Tax=Corynebacterium sanguinis TaxID=2594913 RepID=UPI00223AA9A4|nr:zinc-dependent metalloprotease [Corynebacterium sanguinis]MCT1412259.1 zinc-dependent metalloprotease [Corynebacterium sanguinis]MCT1444904.1 zinc-dependent metalloprotease [Corynebacterium sanguinis]MCT1492923.1 zinc-dependent metalloprotease [Corynebacterium sanguinis]MCT1584367.1 zinc-dependent metalloprotease [Corynebacterium sanguinis]MCT1597639.1 zinc-dependent metalloprotease [Corynebacterium sanguinis]